MNKDYYKDYFEIERNHWWFKIREKIIVSQLRKIIPNNNLNILNIGIATGRTSEVLSSFGIVESIEYDKTCCDFVHEKLGIKVIHGSITDLPFASESFDLVCAFDVIEHVENHSLAIKEMERVCKKNGIIYVTVPAFMMLWSHHDEVNQHFRRYTSKSLLKLFKKSSLKLIKITYFNTLLFLPILIFRMISKVIPKKWIRQNSGSDFNIKGQTSVFDQILKSIFNIEVFLLKFINLPFGVSLLSLWKK